MHTATHAHARQHTPNAAIKGKIDEVLVKLPEPARKKLEEIEKTTGQPKSLLAGGGALFGLFLVFFLCPPQLVFSAVGVGYPWLEGEDVFLVEPHRATRLELRDGARLSGPAERLDRPLEDVELRFDDVGQPERVPELE